MPNNINSANHGNIKVTRKEGESVTFEVGARIQSYAEATQEALSVIIFHSLQQYAGPAYHSSIEDDNIELFQQIMTFVEEYTSAVMVHSENDNPNEFLKHASVIYVADLADFIDREAITVPDGIRSLTIAGRLKKASQYLVETDRHTKDYYTLQLMHFADFLTDNLNERIQGSGPYQVDRDDVFEFLQQFKQFREDGNVVDFIRDYFKPVGGKSSKEHLIDFIRRNRIVQPSYTREDVLAEELIGTADVIAEIREDDTGCAQNNGEPEVKETMPSNEFREPDPNNDHEFLSELLSVASLNNPSLTYDSVRHMASVLTGTANINKRVKYWSEYTGMFAPSLYELVTVADRDKLIYIYNDRSVISNCDWFVDALKETARRMEQRYERFYGEKPRITLQYDQDRYNREQKVALVNEIVGHLDVIKSRNVDLNILEHVNQLVSTILEQSTSSDPYTIPYDECMTGDLITISEYQKAVDTGYLTDDDGIGYPVKYDMVNQDRPINPGGPVPGDATHILWYNR